MVDDEVLVPGPPIHINGRTNVTRVLPTLQSLFEYMK